MCVLQINLGVDPELWQRATTAQVMGEGLAAMQRAPHTALHEGLKIEAAESHPHLQTRRGMPPKVWPHSRKSANPISKISAKIGKHGT